MTPSASSPSPWRKMNVAGFEDWTWAEIRCGGFCAMILEGGEIVRGGDLEGKIYLGLYCYLYGCHGFGILRGAGGEVGSSTPHFRGELIARGKGAYNIRAEDL